MLINHFWCRDPRLMGALYCEIIWFVSTFMSLWLYFCAFLSNSNNNKQKFLELKIDLGVSFIYVKLNDQPVWHEVEVWCHHWCQNIYDLYLNHTVDYAQLCQPTHHLMVAYEWLGRLHWWALAACNSSQAALIWWGQYTGQNDLSILAVAVL